MLNYGVLSKKPTIFKNFTGLEVAEFDALTSKIQEKYNAYEAKRLARERASSLLFWSKMVFILLSLVQVYYGLF